MSRKKASPRPSGRCGYGDLHPAPPHSLEGLLVWPLWLAAHSSGEASPSCLSQLDGFMKQRCSTPFGYEATQAKRWLKVPTKILCETRGLQLFWVIRGGIGLTRRLGAKTSAHRAPNERFDTLPRTRASQKPTWPPPRQENLGRSPGFCSILKRLAFSVVRRRNVLPSSKVSKCQSNGRDLARQRQTSHLRLHPLG